MNLQTIDLKNPLWRSILQKLDPDIYHLPEYVHLEAQRINAIAEAIAIEDGEKIFFLPYLIRQRKILVNNDTIQEVFDVTSPYGYPGILLSGSAARSREFLHSAMSEFISKLREKNICSAFLRMHPILNQGLHDIYSPDICQFSGHTIGVNLTLSPEEIWSQTCSNHRQDINRLKRSGLKAEIVQFVKYFDDFFNIYNETMDRVHAKQLYYFDRDFFYSWLDNLDRYTHLGIVKFEDEVMCACLFTECSGIVQSCLRGTKNKFLKQSPDKLLFDYVRFWAKERGNKFLHLGGGYGGAKDGLYHFKAGFSKQIYNFLTLRLIVNAEQYDRLVNLQARALQTDSATLLNSGFFPAYRALQC
ncbi:MAG: GNAT family N-acetyltransferase [Microcoleus sp. SM1_3_4]|nr:GNAT family N-acetyltransferase [Microcoleus sp. SM1_3_4]